MKIKFIVTLILFFTPLLLNSCRKEQSKMIKTKLTSEQVDSTWDQYKQEILSRRKNEAAKLWEKMVKDYFSGDHEVSLDFSFFSNDTILARKLKNTLAENYSSELISTKENGYVLIKGTTKPYGTQLDSAKIETWVEYMVKLGFENNSTFSVWPVFDPKSKKIWSSEKL